MNRSRRRQASRRGTSAIEFAIIAPLMIAFTFGLVEVGRIMLVKQSATHATREGARMAVKPTATTEEVRQRVQQELDLMGVDAASISVNPAVVQEAEPGSKVTVKVDIGIDSVSWVPGFFSFGTSNITAESSMRRETTE